MVPDCASGTTFGAKSVGIVITRLIQSMVVKCARWSGSSRGVGGRRQSMAGDGMDRIKHLVVVMMENRSFDNLMGFLYADVNNMPPINIPAPPPGGQTTFEGLVAPNPGSPFWNPSNADYFTGKDPVKVS